MFETMTSVVLGDHMGGHTFEPQHGPGGYPRQLSPYRRPYRTKDGYICALVYNDKHWSNFLAAIGQSDLPQRDPRFATYASRATHIDFVYQELERMFRDRTTAEWLAVLQPADIWCAEVLDWPGLLDSAAFRQLDMVQPIGGLRTVRGPLRVGGAALPVGKAAPKLGADRDGIIREFGGH